MPTLVAFVAVAFLFGASHSSIPLFSHPPNIPVGIGTSPSFPSYGPICSACRWWKALASICVGPNSESRADFRALLNFTERI